MKPWEDAWIARPMSHACEFASYIERDGEKLFIQCDGIDLVHENERRTLALAAAAPELYRAVEALLKHCDGWTTGQAIDDAVRVLAKARGEHAP